MYLSGTVYVLPGLLTLVAFALAGPHSKLCLHCDNLEDPSKCTVYQACHGHEESCYTEVRFFHNKYLYKLGCKHNPECQDKEVIVGKRAPGHHEHGQLVCSHCCSTATACNSQQCTSYAAYNKATTEPPATEPPKTATTDPTGSCHDVEDEHFQCSDYDKYNLCNATSGLNFHLGHARCQKHCGFCPEDCVDLEDANFRCSDYDSFSLCSAGSGLAYELGHKRCRKYCGFCGTGGVFTAPVTSQAQDTSQPQDTTTGMPQTAPPQPDTTSVQPDTTTWAPTTSVQPDTTTWAPVAATITVNQGQTTQNGCADLDASCGEWASHGLCTMQTVAGHEIAQVTCRKSCGVCP